MCFAATPVASNWRRLASTRSRNIFLGNSLWPGARAVRNSNGYFSRTGSDSSTSRNSLLPYSNWDSNCGSHFRANVVTASVDPWTDGRSEIAGASAETAIHLAHAFFHDTFHRPAPARMKDSNRLALCVHQNHRQAIGRENCQQNTRGLRDQAVAGECGLGKSQRHNESDPSGSDAQVTSGQGRPLLTAPASTQKVLPGSVRRRRASPVSKSQIQSPAAINFGNPPGRVLKPWIEPRNRLKRIGLQDFVLRFSEES